MIRGGSRGTWEAAEAQDRQEAQGPLQQWKWTCLAAYLLYLELQVCRSLKGLLPEGQVDANRYAWHHVMSVPVCSG